MLSNVADYIEVHFVPNPSPPKEVVSLMDRILEYTS
jgi:hypothetical protein